MDANTTFSAAASDLKASGNDKFHLKEYALAEADYSAALDLLPQGCASKLAVALLSNRAACRDALDNIKGAIVDARRVIAMDATCRKGYFRLAKLLLSRKERMDLEEASRMVCVAVALSRAKIEAVLERLYQEARRALLSSESNLRICLPESTECVSLAVPGICSLTRAFSFCQEKINVICALPGQYTEAIMIDTCHRQYMLLGIGNVVIQQMPSVCHSLYVTRASSLYVSNIRFTGGRSTISQAAIVLDFGDKAVFHDCHVIKYEGAGFLLASEGTSAFLSQCSFQDLPNMAIEVREGALLTGEHIEIARCKQGITAYGGAQQLELSSSSIVNCAHEGIMLAGSFHNAATVMQADIIGKKKSTIALATADTAVQWARTRGIQLIASISETTIRGCGQFGVSIDNGAFVSMYACTLVHNDPYSVIIKGGSDLSMAGCRVEFADKESASPWIALQRKAIATAIPKKVPQQLSKSIGKNVKQSGLYIGINYNGSISLSSCVTVGVEDSLGIVDELRSSKEFGVSQLYHRMMYTKPPSLSNYSHFHPSDTSIPSVETLVHRLPSSWRSGHVARDLSARSPPAIGEMRRPCRSHQDPSWSPTGSENYAIGNTFGYDVTAGVPIQPGTSSLDMLFGACGDIRNLLWTVGARSLDVSLYVVLNDGNIAMLARNAVILEMIASEAPADHILSVWANHELTQEEHASMMSAISKLATCEWPQWLTATKKVDTNSTESAVEAEIRSVLRVWLTCDLTATSIPAERSSRNKATSELLVSQSISLTQTAVGSLCFSKYRKDIAEYIEKGSLFSKRKQHKAPTKLNITLLLPELQYTVYFSSSIFRAVELGDLSHPSAYEALLHTLKPRFKRMASALQLQKCKITLSRCDILAALVEVSGSEFDFIDCSNVADYVSLPALVQAAAFRLKTEEHSRLFVESLVMFSKVESSSRRSAKAFVEAVLGYKLSLMEQLIGLKLVGGDGPPTLVGTNGIRLEFSRAASATPRDPNIDWVDLCIKLSSTTAQDIYSCTASIPSTSAPGAYASPTTLAHLITSCVQPGETADVLLRTILRCGHEKMRFYEWEVKTQTTMQLNILGSDDCFTRIKYDGIPATTMTLFSNHPVLLGISSAPLTGLSISLDQMIQLLSTFAWDAEMCAADFMILNQFLDTKLYVTLLFLGTTCLSVAASSRRLGDLCMEQVQIGPNTRWRTNACSIHSLLNKQQVEMLDRLNSCAGCKAVQICNKCARCRRKSYCCKDCQIQDWKKGHKAECKPA